MPAAVATSSSTERLWAPPLQDVPLRGQPMSSKVERAAAPYRRVLDGLQQWTTEDLSKLSIPLIGSYDQDRSARLLAGIAAVRASLTGASVDVLDALAWFRGAPVAGAGGATARWNGGSDDHLTALLPYVLDPFGETTRRAVIAGRACENERGLRKSRGTFYTPGDVARTLAADVITPDCRTVLDPAVGAGVFLRAAFTRLVDHMVPSEAVRCLYGIDIDPAAIDASALVLTHDWLERQPLRVGEVPAQRFMDVRSRLVCADALQLLASCGRVDLLSFSIDHEPRVLPDEFDAVLMNPPFAKVGGAATPTLAATYKSLQAAPRPGGVNMAWPFWELASRIVSEEGRAGIVLPMSIAYRDDAVARASRGAAFSRGRWELRFFDRAPDALFGDDVKQRVALAIRREGAPGTLLTSRLRRWSVESRPTALAESPNTVVTSAGEDVVPKVGSALEAATIVHLRGLGATLGDGLKSARLSAAADLDGGEVSVIVAPTAYNWIGAFRDVTVARLSRRHAAGKLGDLAATTPTMADAVYCLLASRLFLWWWRAVGDLFHLPLGAIVRAPFPLHLSGPGAIERVAGAGRRCWSAALTAPITATNRGVKTVAYAPPPDSAALDAADQALGTALGLSDEFVRLIRDDAERLRTAGRPS